MFQTIGIDTLTDVQTEMEQWMNRRAETHRQTDGQAGRLIDLQRDRQTNGQADRRTDTQTDRDGYRHAERHRQTEEAGSQTWTDHIHRHRISGTETETENVHVYVYVLD